jgi:hypothetical protein
MSMWRRTSTSTYVTPTQHNVSDDSGSDSKNDSSDDETEMNNSGSSKRRRGDEDDDGKDEENEERNMFREYFSAKSRKLRRDNFKGSKVLGVEELKP